MVSVEQARRARAAVEAICLLFESERALWCVDDAFAEEVAEVGYRLSHLSELDDDAVARLLERADEMIRELRAALGEIAG
jgi:hypothetical protein